MPGGYQLMVTRAKVHGEHPDGYSFELATSATVTVRDGVATLKAPGVDLSAPVASITKSGRAATVTLADGTVWQVARAGCGCGGG